MKTTATPRRMRTIPMILAAATASFSLTALAQDVKPLPANVKPLPAATKPIPTDVKPLSTQVKPGTVPQAQPTAPSPLRFDAPSHDWGRVTDAEKLKHTFKFTNISDQTVTIANVTATCGCTVPQLEKRVYAPGEEGEIHVQFDPLNRRGPQSKQVTVTFADGQGYAPMRLDLASEVLPMLWVEPNRVLFQEAYKGTGGTQQVVVTARKTDFEITSMEGMEQHFSAKVVKVEDAEDNGDPVRKITLEVTLDKNAPIGNYNTQMIFKSNEPKWPEFKIFGTAMVVGELKADPPSAVIRTQQPNTPFETMVVLETRNSVPFDIDTVDWTVEGGHDLNLAVDWEEYDSTRGRPSYRLRFSGVTPAVTSQIRATVKIAAKLPDGEHEELSVVLWGTVRGADAPRMMPPPSGIKPLDSKASPTNVAPDIQGVR